MANFINVHDKRIQQLTVLCESGALDYMPVNLKSLLFDLIEAIRFQDARLIELENNNAAAEAWAGLSEAERTKILKDAPYG